MYKFFYYVLIRKNMQRKRKNNKYYIPSPNRQKRVLYFSTSDHIHLNV